jgi:hypothetical protein
MTNYNKNLLNKNYFKHIKEICPKNKDDVLFLRIDYYLKMKYSNLYFNNNNKKDKHKNNDLVWHSHYIKIVPIFPSIDIQNNNNSKIISNINFDFNDNENSENDDYYIFEVIENKNINLIYSQEKYIYSQVKDIENELNYDYYYFGNNKRKHLFEYNIIKNNEEKEGFSIYVKKIFLIIIIFVLIIFGLNLYKAKAFEKSNKNDFMNDIKSKLPQLQNNLINNEDYVDVKMENQNGKALSPKSKSISNLSTNCSIDQENKQNNKIEPKSSSILINFKFINKQKNTSSGKKRDHSKNQSRNSSIHAKRRWSKLKSSMKILIKDLKKLTKKEGEELKDLFATYISDINKNTSDSNLNLNSNSNLTDNDDIYKKIFSLIKSEDSSSSEDIDINEQSQGNFTGELENNFLFSFDNGRLLKLYKDFQFIGKGGFGVVFKATQKIDESQCAIKVMKINLDIKDDKEKEDLKVTQEIKSMLKFKKKNIVRYKTCWFEFKQKKAKNKRERAMSLEQRYTPGIGFKKDSKKNKNSFKNYLKTSLERIQSISKEIKLAEKQNNAQKKGKRKSSIIWDDGDESDSDTLGANKNYAIKEEGEDTYINLEDNESNIEEVSENINDENDDNSNSNSGSESENSNSENDNSNNLNEFKARDSIKEEKKSFNENQDDNKQKDEVENFQSKIKDLECNSNSNLKLKNINNSKDFSSDNNEDNNEDEDEYNNLRNKKNLLKTDLNNESSSKNTNSKDNNLILVGKDSENNSIFDEEIKKEKEELNIEKKTENYEANSIEESESDEDDDEDEDEDKDEDDLKNNSDNEGLRTPKKKKKKKKNKTYPIYFFIQMEYC